MNVAELIETLQQYDPDAEVLLGTQANYPFEYSIQGIIARDEITDEDGEQTHPTNEKDEEDIADVFIVEGEQLRYGSKGMWV